MVEQFLGLKLRLIRGALRRDPWQLFGMVLALAYGTGTAVIVVAGLVSLRFVDIEFARSAEVVFGAVVLLVCAVLPLMIGVDDTLDPRRFALFGIRPGRLAAGLALAGLLSVGALIVGAIAVALIVTWSRTESSLLLAVASVPVIVLTSVLTSRVSASLAGLLLSSRRSRDAAGLVIIVALVCLAPLLASLASIDWSARALPVLTAIERVVSWTPLGAPWAVAADAAAGDLAGTAAKLAIALGWLVLLAVAWRALVAIALVTPPRQAAARQYHGLGWFDRMPATPIGAVAARNLTYWARDGRYGTTLAIIPFVPLVMVVALHIAGLPLSWLALLPVPVMCLFLSWAVHNDVSFDNTAVWLHLAASVTGRDDRWGRLVPVLLLGVPLIGGGSVLAAWAFGDWAVLPSVVGVSSSILLGGLGLSSIMSAAFPYPTARPGESPFAQPQGGGGAAGLVQAVSFLVILLLAAPATGFALLGLIGSDAWHVWSLLVGVGTGLAALIAGALIGAHVYDRRAPALLAAAIRN
ncbi:MAG: hypothetical protein QM635_10810 [Microbacteriaceae bacterium]